VVPGPLKLVFYGDDLHPEAGPRQVFANGADVRGPLAVEAQEREDADLAG
jgi:hypothetical protein